MNLYICPYPFDENLTVSLKDNRNHVNELAESDTSLNKKDMDTSYIQTKDISLDSDHSSIPLMLYCRNMTSAQSEFLLDYTDLKADFGIMAILHTI